MPDIPFKSLSGGLFKEVGPPDFGQQHKGIAPGGAMDCFSYQSGNALLKTDLSSPALEIVFVPSLQVTKDCYFVITGARYGSVSLEAAGSQTTEKVEHAVVYRAGSGDTLRFEEKSKIGFRTYLCFVESHRSNPSVIGTNRKQFSDLFQWMDVAGKVRVVEGPEYSNLVNKDAFTDNYWIITNDFSDMGFRLTNSDETPRVDMPNMISEAVADGTVQLTPKGPIVLLRYRQTVGGYPRIYNIISADVDVLSQYSPNQILHFRKVTVDEAIDIAKLKADLLGNLL